MTKRLLALRRTPRNFRATSVAAHRIRDAPAMRRCGLATAEQALANVLTENLGPN